MLVVAAFILIGTEAGRVWLADQANKWLNGSDPFVTQQLTLELVNLHNPQINRLLIDKLVLYKNESPWLTITNLDIQIDLASLWEKRVVIDHLQAKQVYYLHQQFFNRPNQETNVETTAKEPLTIPPISVSSLIISELIIDSLLPTEQLPDYALENKMSYSLKGNAALESLSELAVNLEAESQTSGLASFTLHTRQITHNAIALEATISEPENGWLGHWLQLPISQPIAASLQANVTREQERYRLDIEKLELPIHNHQVALSTTALFRMANRNPQASVPWQLIINNGELRIDETSNTINAEINYPKLSAKIETNQFPLAILQPWLQAIPSGVVSSSLTLSNTITDPQFDGWARGKIIYQANTLDVDLSANGHQTYFQIDKLTVEKADTQITAKGSVDLNGANNDLNFTVSNFQQSILDDFNISLPEAIAEQLKPFDTTIKKANGHLSGAIRALEGSFNVSALGTYQQQPFASQSEFTLTTNALNIISLTVDFPEGRSLAKGNIDWQARSFNIETELIHLPLSLLSLAGISLPAGLTANVSATTKIAGQFDNPVISTNATLNGNYQQIPIALQSQANWQSGKLTVDHLELTNQTATLLSGHGHYSNSDMDIALAMNRLPTALLELFSISVPGGEFNADLTAKGSLLSPNLQGSIHYSAPFFGYDKYGKKQPYQITWDTDLTTSNQRLQIASSISRDGHQPGRLKLSLPVDYYAQALIVKRDDITKLPILIDLKANVDLQALSFLWDSDIHQITGRLDGDLRSNGSLSQPDITGVVELLDTSYFNNTTGSKLENLNCSVSAVNRTISVDACNASDGNHGSYSIDGSLKLPQQNDYGKVHFYVNAENANIIKRPDIDSQANGKITLSGDFKSLLAEGTLEVTPFNAIIDIDLGSNTPELKVHEVYDEEIKLSKQATLFQLPTLTFDLNIVADKQAYLRGRGLEAELKGNLSIKGSSASPDYNGEFSTIRGAFDVFGKSFNLEQGQVNFVNDSIAISVRGVYENDDKQIIAEVIGKNDEFTITFSSIPNLPEDEIISYIIFGESVQNISPIKAIQLAYAIQTLRGGSGSFFDPIATTRDILGVDTISIDNETTENGDSGINVGVGKYINDRVYLEIERTPDPSQPWKGSIRIELTPKINLQSTTGGKSGIGRAEIIWSNDY
ncbi:translocation/assembly module TamB domain-containing protein [Halioxenophilus sp. WMMB6]|uniref:translocation/assembly module TamB domain-containing protein n=1 Tax=Halioxenophilus sp. WMMB6 TaxID=3073815 RepID=UPI00295EF409|nr:translocation/assembly module TamB domain-containing protein [Halioxenophilus sp. WMMB6]